jgi:hypothetical protein
MGCIGCGPIKGIHFTFYYFKFRLFSKFVSSFYYFLDSDLMNFEFFI